MKLRQLTAGDIAWLETNQHADTNALWLKHKGNEDMEFLITQLQCRQKARGKLEGDVADEYFIYPNPLAVEQCSGSSMASLHASMVGSDDRVLDMTMGLGIDAMTIARKCREIVMLDLKQDNVDAAVLNIERLALSNAHALCGDSIQYLTECPPDGAFDVIFIDPARRGVNGRRLYALADCEPDVTSLLPMAFLKAKRMIVKASPMLDIDKMVSELAPYHADVIVTGTATECKEVIADIRFEKPCTDDYDISCIIPSKGRIDFSADEERKAVATYHNPTTGMYLFEPSPTLLKAGCFNLLSQRYGLHKIAPVTHLYLSEKASDDLLLGSWWKISEVRAFDKRAIKEIPRLYPSISISTRNFPIDADILRRKLKVSENPGQLKLWGTTDHLGKKCIIIGERISEKLNQNVLFC